MISTPTEELQTNPEAAKITQADWEAGIKIANLFKLANAPPPNPPQQTKSEAAVVKTPAKKEETRFTGFKETKKKVSSGKKRRAQAAASASFVPMFEEDSDGNVVNSTISERFAAIEAAAASGNEAGSHELGTPPKENSCQSAAVQAEQKDTETGRLAHVTFPSFYGSMLTDSQRVARFNDLRAF